MTASAKKLSRREAKERSRYRLVSATIDVLHQEGPAGLTTGKVARAAGLSQPSFYVHFKSMDDALEAAAVEIGEQIRAALRAERARLASERSHETMRAAFRATLNAFLLHPTFTEVVLRYRRDRATPVGKYARALFSAIREDILSDLRACGLDESRLPSLGAFVELMLGMTLAMLEGLIDGRFTDRDECADTLARSTTGVFWVLSMRDS